MPSVFIERSSTSAISPLSLRFCSSATVRSLVGLLFISSISSRISPKDTFSFPIFIGAVITFLYYRTGRWMRHGSMVKNSAGEALTEE